MIVLSPTGTGGNAICGNSWRLSESVIQSLGQSFLAPTGNSDFSLSVYVMPQSFFQSIGTGRSLITIGGDTRGNGGASIKVSTTGKVGIRGPGFEKLSNTALIPDDWAHLLLTYSKSDLTLRLSVNCMEVLAVVYPMDLVRTSADSGMGLGDYYFGAQTRDRSGTYYIDHASFADHVATCNEVKAPCVADYATCAAAGSAVCGSGYMLKAQASSIYCGGTGAQCKQEQCCDATCVWHTCSAGLVAKASPAGVACGTTQGDCSDAVCCEVTCSAHSCPSGAIADSASSGYVCGATPGDCSNDDCCLATCVLHSCSLGWVVRTSAISSICGKASPMTDGCSDEMCCDATCGTYTCAGGLVAVSNSGLVLCGGAAGACTEELCCRQKCETYGCTAGMSPTGSPDTVCAGSACTDAECCEATCRLHDCPALHPGYADKLSSPILCGGPVSSCTKDMCCVATCDTHTCQQGHRLKSTSGMIECSTGPCDDALCCDAYCDYSMFGCDANYIPKNAPDAIRCGDTAVSCTNVLCCDATCGTHTCTPSVGWGTLPAAAGNRCGASSTDCTDGMCCAALCNNGASTCTAPNYKKIPSPELTQCGGGTTAECTTAVCCDLTCASHMCGPDTTLKGTAADIACVGGVCTDAQCCNVLCSESAFTCGTGMVKKSDAGSIECGGSVGDCTDAVCCDFTCQLKTCSAPLTANAAKAGDRCGAALSTCTDELCCLETCVSHTCPGDMLKKTTAPGIVCVEATPLLAGCSDTLCCDVTCTLYDCPTKDPGHANLLPKAAQRCGADVATCTNAKCCVETCDTHTCQQGHRLKSTSGMIECSTGPCDDALCCDAYCDYSMFGCDANYIRKNAPEAIRCGDTAVSCTNVLCCDATCGTHTCTPSAGWGTLPAAAGNRCGASSTDCTDGMCCAALCNNAASTCTAPNYKKIPSPELTQCGGGTTAECTTAVCCDLTCASHMCGPDTTLKGTAADIACVGGVCTDAQCCNVLCSESEVTCGTGMVKKSDAGSIECGESVGDCADSVCCDFTCQLKTCSAPLTDNAAKAGDRCGAALSTCTDELCCLETCVSHTCPGDMLKKTTAPGIVCVEATPLLAGCSDTLCCDVTCTLYDCPTKDPGHANLLPKAAQRCGADVATCTNAKCCVETCDTHTCQQGHRLKSTSGMIECSTGPCDDALCCDAYCDYSMFGCETNYIRKNAPEAIRCGDTAVSCTNVLCCDATCGTHTCTPSVGWGTLPAAAGNRCNGDCTSELCCAVTCGHPDFSCPLGTAPLSEVENVTCGATVQSCNHTACCLETPVADTLAPSPQPAPLSEQVQPVSDTGMAAVALTGAAVAGGFSAGAAMRLALAASPCREAIPRSVNPAGVEVDGSDAVGADLVSMGITAGFALLCLGVLKLVSLKGRVLCPRIFSEVDTQGLLRLPAVPLLLFQFFFQGMTLAGMNLVLHGDKVWHSTVGAAVVLLCLAVPVLTMRTVLRSVGVEAAYAVAVGRTNTPVLFLIGPGEWVNLTHKTMWVERYSTVIRTFRQGRMWFLLLEYAASFALSAVKATQPLSLAGCGHVKLASGFIFAALLLLEAAYWPHARSRDSACDTTMLGLQAAAMALLAAGYYTEDLDHWGFSAAAVLLLAAMCLLLLKAVLDVAATVYLLCTDRRELLQEDILAQRDAASQSLLSLTLLTNTDPSVSFSSPAVSPASGTSDTLLGSTWHRAPAAVLTTEPPRHLLKDNTPHEPGSLIRGLLGPAAATAANEPLLGKTKDESQDPITICSAWRSVPRAAVTEDHPAVDPLHHTPDSDTGRLADCLKDGAEFADPLESCLLSSFKGPRASFDSRSYGDPDPQSPDSFGLPLVRIVSSCRGFPRQAPTTPYTLGSSATSVSSHRPSVCL